MKALTHFVEKFQYFVSICTTDKPTTVLVLFLRIIKRVCWCVHESECTCVVVRWCLLHPDLVSRHFGGNPRWKYFISPRLLRAFPLSWGYAFLCQCNTIFSVMYILKFHFTLLAKFTSWLCMSRCMSQHTVLYHMTTKMLIRRKIFTRRREVFVT